jgi:hypothetical protein
MQGFPLFVSAMIAAASGENDNTVLYSVLLRLEPLDVE